MRHSLLLTKNKNGAALLGCHSKLVKQYTCTQELQPLKNRYFLFIKLRTS